MSTIEFNDVFDTNFDNLSGDNKMCCTNPEIDCIDGSYICHTCGTISGSRMDDTPYSTTQILVDKHLFEQSMTVFIGGPNKYLRCRQLWSIPGKEKSLSNDIKILKEVCSKLKCDGILIDEIITLYKRTSETEFHRGVWRSGLFGACVYTCCKKRNIIVD